MDEPFDADEPIKVPIENELDLHTFQPKEVADVVREYLAACREKGILETRIIHGKGIGNLRRTVHAVLGRHPHVATFAEASAPFGGAGATFVKLRPP
jgi:DNA-nicking Smr family endonuclease